MLSVGGVAGSATAADGTAALLLGAAGSATGAADGLFVARLILAVAGISAGVSTAGGALFDADEYLTPGWVAGPGRAAVVYGPSSGGYVSGPDATGAIVTNERG